MQAGEQASQLVRARAEAEMAAAERAAGEARRAADDAKTVAQLDDMVLSLRGRLSDATERYEAADKELVELRAVRAAAAEWEGRARETAAQAQLQEAERQQLAGLLAEATAAVAKLKGMVRQERSAKAAAEDGLARQARLNAETNALERAAAAEELAQQRRSCEQVEKNWQERLDRAGRETAALEAELKSLLKQLEAERGIARERDEREKLLAQQIDALSSHFGQLESSLARTSQEKAELARVVEVLRLEGAAERGSLEARASAAEERLRPIARLSFSPLRRSTSQLRADVKSFLASAMDDTAAIVQFVVASAAKSAQKEATLSESARGRVALLERELDKKTEAIASLESRSALTEELQRSLAELTMLADVQRMEAATQRRAIEAQHAQELLEVSAHFKAETASMLERHRLLVDELERVIQSERERADSPAELGGSSSS